jgi:ABC-2 type transport system permease protein
MRSRIGPIAYKEWLHVRRDWRTLAIAIVLPLILVLIFGYAIRFEVEQIPLAVLDQDDSQAGRDLVRTITGGRTFNLVAVTDSPAEIRRLLEEGHATLALVIPPEFSADIAAGRTPKFQVIVDGAENNTGALAIGYLQSILIQYSQGLLGERLNGIGVSSMPGVPPVTLDVRYWFNEELESPTFIVPGIIAYVMMLLCTLLTSQIIVRERERGTMEQLIATPVRATEIVIGKLLPYFALGLFDTMLITAVGYFLFGVPFRGSLLLLLGFTCLFAVVGLGIGMLISIIASNQVFALQLAIISQMLPALLLSGFMFPIKEMPLLLQWITHIVPARYAIEAFRGIFLKGTGARVLWPLALILLGFATLFVTASAKRFRKRLE